MCCFPYFVFEYAICIMILRNTLATHNIEYTQTHYFLRPQNYKYEIMFHETIVCFSVDFIQFYLMLVNAMFWLVFIFSYSYTIENVWCVFVENDKIEKTNFHSIVWKIENWKLLTTNRSWNLENKINKKRRPQKPML